MLGDVNKVDDFGITPLMKCGMFNRSEMAKLMLENGAKIENLDQNGMSAGDWAREMGHDVLGEMLD